MGSRSFVGLTGTNDLLFFPRPTDRYFTHGTQLTWYSPWLEKSPIRFLLVGHGRPTRAIGLILTQNLYTPTDLVSGDPGHFDRPFASYLTLTQRSISVMGKARIGASIEMGVLGNRSGGYFIQNFIHGLTPHSDSVIGWEHQVRNDLIIQYKLDGSFLIHDSKYHRFLGLGSMDVGTLRDEASLGIAFQTGMLEDSYLKYLFVSQRKWTAYMEFHGGVHYTAYDATLQGGVLLGRSPTGIPSEDLIRLRYSGTMRINLRWGPMEVSGGWQYLSRQAMGMEEQVVGSLRLRYFW